MDAIVEFLAAIERAGLPAPDTVSADGRIHRFSTNGKRGDDSGWAVLRDGIVPNGSFGDWRTGEKHRWRANVGRSLTDAERRDVRKQRLIERLKRRQETKRLHAEAAQFAAGYKTLPRAPADHPYFIKKGVTAPIRVDDGGLLVVPMFTDGELVNLQTIDAEGAKRFLPGGRVKGCYFPLGTIKDALYVAEGVATAASIYEATGDAVAVAFSAGNLLPVATAMRTKYPELEIVLAADNDVRGDGTENVGAARAAEAAEAVGGRVAVPQLAGKKADFNDVHRELGVDAVREQLAALCTPPCNSATAQPPASAPAPGPQTVAPLRVPALAELPDVLAAFRRDVLLRGLVGELATAQLLYLAITSRLLDAPVSIGVKGHSASGKSFTVGRVLAFFPEEAVIVFTGMSERALVYRKDDYAHRTLVIYEVTGLREGNEDDLTSYFIRSLLSEGRICYDVTVRAESGQYETQRIVKEGPTNLIFTTTKTRVHAENETRVLSLNTDDGTEQTKAVLAALALESRGDVDLAQWRELQVWLQSAERRVTIPFASELAAAVPALAVRLRRDFGAVLSLIRSHAILHQRTRERDELGRIVATLDDYSAVRELVADVLSEGVGATVSGTVRETVAAIERLGDEDGVTVAGVAAHLRVDKSNASRRIRRAADGGYVRNLESRLGKPGRWVTGDPLPETVDVLPDPERLRNHATVRTAGDGAAPGGCAVAPVQEGVHTGTPNVIEVRERDTLPEGFPFKRPDDNEGEFKTESGEELPP